jgi:hypothetical protein
MVINKINFTAQKPSYVALPDSTLIKFDSLEINGSVSIEKVAANSCGFIHSAYATEPCDPQRILKNKIESVEITADKELFNLSAGEVLNQFLVQKYSNGHYTVENWVNTMNHPNEGFFENVIFRFNQNPNSNEFIKLKLKFTFQDGTIMFAETVHFKII